MTEEQIKKDLKRSIASLKGKTQLESFEEEDLKPLFDEREKFFNNFYVQVALARSLLGYMSYKNKGDSYTTAETQGLKVKTACPYLKYNSQKLLYYVQPRKKCFLKNTIS
ncbi:unnamed protein product [Arctia plantaginis]|uniref:Uncharacterized protein n=1 Tax=Arctia plantaginis TaxID=874455 RepID=A0A8S1BKG9_ARCPL|nr:unnamed protein product [Arctia plantaginis]